MNFSIAHIIGTDPLSASCDERQMLQIIQRLLQAIRSAHREMSFPIPSLFTAMAMTSDTLEKYPGMIADGTFAQYPAALVQRDLYVVSLLLDLISEGLKEQLQIVRKGRFRHILQTRRLDQKLLERIDAAYNTPQIENRIH